MSDQPRIVLHKNPDESIPHKTSHPGVQFIHPGKWTLTNRKLLFIWNVLAVFVITSVYIYSEQEGTIHLQSRYARVPLQEYSRKYHNGSVEDGDDMFPHWYSGASEWIPKPDSKESDYGPKNDDLQFSPEDQNKISEENHGSGDQPSLYSFDKALNRTKTLRGEYEKTRNEVFSQLEALISTNTSSKNIGTNASSLSLFISQIEEVLGTVIHTITDANQPPTRDGIKYVLDDLRLRYSGSLLAATDALLDGLYNSMLLDQHNDIHVDDLKLRFLPQSRSPCWVEVLIPGKYYHRYSGTSFARVTRSIMSRVYKERLKKRIISWRMRCLPAFFLGGFPKCGTTDLYLRLGTHQEIYASKHKEPHWWSRKRLGLFRNSKYPTTPVPLATYVTVYDRIANVIAREDSFKNALTVDGSASTIWDYGEQTKNISDPLDIDINLNTTVAHQISRLLPDSLMLLIVREPVSRFYSEFLYFHSEFVKNKHGARYQDEIRHQVLTQIQEFEWCLSRTGHDMYTCVIWLRSNSNAKLVRVYIGLYYVYIRFWLRYFPQTNVKVITLDEYNKQPASVLQDVARFLKLDDYPEDVTKLLNDNHHHYNARKSDVEPLAKDTEAILRAFYKPYNRKLAELLHDDKFIWL